jgi:hypothetical protein
MTQMTPSTIKPLARHRVVAATLVLFLLTLCLSSMAPAAAETGCRSLDQQHEVCGQSVAPDQIPVAAHIVPAVRWAPVLSTLTVPPAMTAASSQFHADPSAPRAPPLS